MPQSAADQAKAKQEAERQALERLKASIAERVNSMKNASPVDAEKSHAWVKDQAKNPKVPMDFKKQMLDLARTYECAANMRATDRALDDAVKFAVAEQMQARGTRIAMARQYFSKACQLGCPEDFRKATQRLIETAMMTGGVHTEGPTKAKPQDIAPKNPNQAKIPTAKV